MKKDEIKVGGYYTAKVSGKITTVRVDAIQDDENRMPYYRGGCRYDVTNLATGRKITFRSAAKFRSEMSAAAKAVVDGFKEGEQRQSPPSSGSGSETSEFEVVGTIHKGGLKGGTASLTKIKEGEDCSDPTSVPYAEDFQVTAPASLLHNLGLASRIAATRQTREVGTPVAGMIPNAEQESILAAAAEPGLQVLVVGAGAGTGKTATLKMLEQVLLGNGQYTAFNTSLVEESKAKFVKAACNTTHSLAFRAVGKSYQHRLGGERMRSEQIARILGIEPISITLKDMGPPDDNRKPTDKVKTLQASFLAGQVLTAIKRFCQSADMQIGPEHFRYIAGIDTPTDDGKYKYENSKRVIDYLISFAIKAWADLSHVDGQLPFSHDCYVKLWQLGQGDERPIIAANYILLDEAQDTAPVFLDVIRRQEHALVVLVGDSNQSIYEWRGAVDAMKAYPNAPRRMLSQSYRFGQAIADVANTILATLDEPTDLVMSGMPTIPSRVARVTEPRCYLYRTNAGAVGRVMAAISENKQPHLIGGGADVVAWCQAAVDLQGWRGTRHPELCCFDTWEEVVQYSKTDEGADMRLMVKLVTDFGAARIRDALKNMPKEENADVVVSTAHKSKGREWDTVRLGQDFPTANKMLDPDRRLLYVAATRAKLTLDISECPPFCGAYTQAWGEGGPEERWVPGLEIIYTQPMPTEFDQATWIKPVISNGVQPDKQPAQMPALEPDGRFRFGSLDGKWYVMGPPIPDVKRNHVIRVPRRDGTAPTCYIQSVVKKDADKWWYDVTARPA